MHTFVNERMTLDSSTMLLQLRNRYWRKIDERKLGNCRLILSKNRLNFRFRLTQSNTISELNHIILIFFCGKLFQCLGITQIFLKDVNVNFSSKLMN